MNNPYAPPQSMVVDVAQSQAEFVRAKRVTRLRAAILDGIIFNLPVVGGLLIAAVPDRPGDLFRSTTIGLVFTAVALLVWFVFTIKLLRANGQSIGKKIQNIKTVRADGSAASLNRLIWLRNVLNTGLHLIPLYQLVDPLFIFGESQRCLHDRIADTIVINA